MGGGADGYIPAPDTMMEDSDSTRIALTQQSVFRLEEWAKTHAVDDSNRFEQLFKYIKERHDKTDKMVSTLWDDNNERRGALKFTRLAAGMFYGIIALTAGYFGAHGK